MDASQNSGWATLPADLLVFGISPLVSVTSRVAMLSTCRSWHLALKAGLLSMDELAYVDGSQSRDADDQRGGRPGSNGEHRQVLPAAYSSVQSVSSPLVRSKWGAAHIQVSPWIRGPEVGHIPALLHRTFPSMTRLVLTGQQLPPSLLPVLAAAAPRVQVLDLGGTWGYPPSDLVEALPAWQKLAHLSLAGTQLKHSTTGTPGPDSPAALLAAATFGTQVAPLCPWHPPLPEADTQGRVTGSAVTREILAAVAQLPSLTSLDLSLKLLYAPRPGASPSDRQAIRLAGIPIFHECEPLTRLTSLTELHIGRNRLSSQDCFFLGHMTHLRRLTACWQMRAAGEPEVDELQLTPGVWSGSLLQLRGLSELSLGFVAGPGQNRGLQLSALTGLTSLRLAMCRTLDTVLSVGRLTVLRSLSLTHLRHPGSPELVVQVAASLPHLTELDLSGALFTDHFEPSGDIVVRGLSRVRPQLQVLLMRDVPVHGGGLTPMGLTPCLPSLTSLSFNARALLLVKYRDLGALTGLQHLELHGLQRRQFLAAAKNNCLQELRRLTRLTSLTLLAPRRARTLAYYDGLGLMQQHNQPHVVQQPQVAGGGPAGPAAPGPGVQQVPLQLPAGILQQLQQLIPGLQQLQQQQEQVPDAVWGWGADNGGGGAGGPGPDALNLEEAIQALVNAGVAAIEEQQAALQPQVAPPAQGQGLVDEDELLLPEEEGGEGSSDDDADESGSGSEAFGSDEDDDSEPDDDDDDDDLDEDEEEEMVDAEGDDLPAAPGEGGAPGGPLTGQAAILAALAITQARYREPHLHFLSALTQLQVLHLEALGSDGSGLRHLSSMSRLRELCLHGAFEMTPSGLATLGQLRFPWLESFSLSVCTWEAADHSALETTVASAMAGSSGSGSTWGVPALLSLLPAAMPAVVHVHVGSCTGLSSASLTQLINQLHELRYLQLSGLPQELGTAPAMQAALKGAGGSRLRVVRGCSQPELEPHCGFTLLSYQGCLVDLESMLHVGSRAAAPV